VTVGGWMALIRAAVFKLQQNSFHVCSLHQHETFSNKFLPQISVNSCCLSYNSDTCSIFSFGWHRNGSFCQLFAQRCAVCVCVCVCVCVWVLVHTCRCTQRAGGCGEWKVSPPSFLSTENELQAALWPHPVLCCRSLLLCRFRYSNRNELIFLYKVENLS